jgi:plasmid maintenance system antidote protein VapI
MTFYVEGFEVVGDWLVSEHRLEDPSEEELAEILGLEDVDELYAGDYPLTPEMLNKIVARYGIVLTPEPQEYFLGARSDE